MKRIFDTQTSETIWRGADYLVDGQPGALPEHFRLLVDVDIPAPEIDPETHKLAHYQRMEGNEWRRGWDSVPLTPEEIEARIPRPPSEVGAGQIHAAMLALDIADDEAALDTLIVGIINSSGLPAKERAIARVLWKRATIFRRSHPFVSLVQAALGKDAAFMDQLFFTADTF